MADAPPSRRPFRLVRWSVFGLALVGLGFLLHAWLPPRPRCTIYPELGMICLSPDGATLVTGQITPFVTGGETFPQQIRWISREGGVQVWDTHSGRLIGTHLQGKNIRCGFFSPSCRYAVAWQEWESDFDPTDENPEKRIPKRIGEPGIFYLLDLHAQTEKQVICKGFAERDNDFHALHVEQFSPKDTFVFLYGYGQPCLLIETATGTIVKSFPGLTAFHGFVPDETLMVLEAKKGQSVDLELWNPQTRQVLCTLANVKGAALAPDGRSLAANLPEGLIVMELATLRKHLLCSAPKKWSREENPFSPDGKTLVTFEDGIMEIWDVAAGQMRGGPHKLSNRDRFSSCTFAPDSSCFSLVQGQSKISLWDVSSATMLWTKEGTDKWIETKFSPDSRSLILCQYHCLGNTNMIDARYEVLETRTGQKRHNLPIGIEQTVWSHFHFTGDYQLLTVQVARQPQFLEKWLGDWWPFKNASPEQLRVVDVSTGSLLASLDTDALTSGWLSGDGRTLVTQNAENVQVWDLPLRPPLLLVIGIPLGLGLIVFLFSNWRARRRSRTQVASSSTIPNSIMGK